MGTMWRSSNPSGRRVLAQDFIKFLSADLGVSLPPGGPPVLRGLNTAALVDAANAVDSATVPYGQVNSPLNAGSLGGDTCL